MLNRGQQSYTRIPLPHKQRGVVLFITLIVLVAMTLAAIALVRSVDTSNVIAGNLSFRQAATHSGDSGIEAAVAWLEANNTGTTLHNDITASGYSASRQDPATNQSWDNFWTTVIAPAGRIVTLNGGAPDAAGNVISYAISRLCNAQGDPTSPTTGCAVSIATTNAAAASSSQGVGEIGLQYSSQLYYRITARIVGPRNTVSYVQSIVSL